jgi:hypothetical protein
MWDDRWTICALTTCAQSAHSSTVVSQKATCSEALNIRTWTYFEHFASGNEGFAYVLTLRTYCSFGGCKRCSLFLSMPAGLNVHILFMRTKPNYRSHLSFIDICTKPNSKFFMYVRRAVWLLSLNRQNSLYFSIHVASWILKYNNGSLFLFVFTQ